MKKQNKYRFNLSFDETDENHCQVCDFLNNCGRKKARYIVKAVKAYWALQNGESPVIVSKRAMIPTNRGDKPEFLSADENSEINQTEVELMKKNFDMLNDWD